MLTDMKDTLQFNSIGIRPIAPAAQSFPLAQIIRPIPVRSSISVPISMPIPSPIPVPEPETNNII